MLSRENIIAEIKRDDETWFKGYKKPKDSDYHLHNEFDPCPYEGDIENARIILLLANPGYDKDTHQEEINFINKGKGGWPLAGLHPEAKPIKLKKWWRSRLGSLKDLVMAGNTDEDKFKIISQQVAAIQLVPWASVKWDEILFTGKSRIPSSNQSIALVKKIASPKKIFLIMRCKHIWQKELVGIDGKQFTANSCRSAHISENNFAPNAWDEIKKVFQS